MKKAVAFIAFAGIFSALLITTGCSSKTTECAMCNKTKKCKAEKIDGKKLWICGDEDCQGMFEVAKALNEASKKK